MGTGDEKQKFQYASLKFLYEMELVDDPQLINNMKLNVFSISGCINDVEFLSSYLHKSMLVYIELNWLGRTFLKKRIESGVTDRVQQLLPNFKFRVTTEKRILDMALEKVKTALKGETNEKLSNSSTDGSNSDSGSSES